MYKYIILNLSLALFIIPKGHAHDTSYYKLAQIKNPTNEQSQSIGSYANGCLKGGIKLPINGDGFQLMRLSRERYFAHQNLYNFIKEFSKEIKKNHSFKGIIVGDTGRAIGGAMPSGHASHQIGLDVDIWLRPAFNKILTKKERETISATSHVTPRQTIRKSWNSDYTNFILKAASYPQVARIFVNPAIKKEICKHTNWKKNLSKLSKIRPWFGHDSHMHIRLKCDSKDKKCINQAPPLKYHGCKGNDIDWWFTQEALNPKKKNTPLKIKTFNDLPKSCQNLYKESLL